MRIYQSPRVWEIHGPNHPLCTESVRNDPAYYFRDLYVLEIVREYRSYFFISHKIMEEDTGTRVSIEQAIDGYREGKRYVTTFKWPTNDNHIICYHKYYRVNGVDFMLKTEEDDDIVDDGSMDWGVLSRLTFDLDGNQVVDANQNDANDEEGETDGNNS